MVQAIDFAVRDFAGAKQHGSVAGDTQGNFIQIGAGDSISLNLSKTSSVAYEQQGGDLLIRLADGRMVVLSNYFNAVPGQENHLYISADGEMTEVLVQPSGDGVLFADYGPVSGWDKWSPLDDLRFTTADTVVDTAVRVAPILVNPPTPRLRLWRLTKAPRPFRMSRRGWPIRTGYRLAAPANRAPRLMFWSMATRSRPQRVQMALGL